MFVVIGGISLVSSILEMGLLIWSGALLWCLCLILSSSLVRLLHTFSRAVQRSHDALYLQQYVSSRSLCQKRYKTNRSDITCVKRVIVGMSTWPSVTCASTSQTTPFLFASCHQRHSRTKTHRQRCRPSRVMHGVVVMHLGHCARHLQSGIPANTHTSSLSTCRMHASAGLLPRSSCACLLLPPPPVADYLAQHVRLLESSPCA